MIGKPRWVACLFAGVVLLFAAGIAAQESAPAVEPFPKYDRNTPEGARAVLDWLARATLPGADGKRRCVASNLLVLIRAFPKSEPIDAVFREFVARGGVAGAAAIYRLEPFEKRVDLVSSDDECVREFVTPLLIREIAQVAESNGRVATARTTKEVREVVAAHDGKPHQFTDDRPVRLWSRLAVVESTAEGKTLLHLLEKSGDGWKYLGQQILFGG
jgi:hypothetical protein